MDWVAGAVDWISANESFLSGLAAIVAVATVAIAPIGIALRQRRREAASVEPPAAAPDPAPTPPAHGERGLDRPSLAVLPFLNLSEDREQEFLADGMTEDLITGLAANRHLSVVSRNSTFAYKGRSPDVREVGRELGVRYVLEGSVRRVGERMRTTAQLIEAASGDHLWAEKYDRPYAEMFDVQDEVVASIAGALNAQLSIAEYERASREKPSELGAWELVQRAMGGIFRQSPTLEANRAHEAALRAAVELDPDYAYAHSGLAWCLYANAINGWQRDLATCAQEARLHLQAAMDGEVGDPLVLYMIGGALLYSGRFERAVRTLERSLDTNPHQPDAHVHLGLALGHLGCYAEAHAHFDRAESLAPTGGMSVAYGWYRSFVLGFEGRQAEAVTLLESFLERVPRYTAPRVMLGLCLEELARSDAARAAIARAAQEAPEVHLEGLVLMFAAHPDPEIGAARVEKLREYWSQA